MPLLEDLRAALHPVVAQDPHPYLSTDVGMAAITTAVTNAHGPTAAATTAHLRTSEYVVATYRVGTGRLLARAGHPAVAGWHAEELTMARLWAAAGAAVAAPCPAPLVVTASAAVSTWPYLAHDPEELPDPHLAGQALAALHQAGHHLTTRSPFTDRPFRAPGKTARRLLALADGTTTGDTVDNGRAAVLLRAATAIADLTGQVDGDQTTIHGDYQPGNWLATPAGVTVVDFATSCTGPALWDLTLLEGRCGPDRRYPRSYWEAFCHGYGVPDTVLDGTAAQQLRTLATAVAGLRRAPTSERWRALDRAAT